MIAKLEILKEKWEEVGKLITDPQVITDQKRYVKLTREYNELKKIVDVYHVYKNTIDNLESAKAVLATEKDEEFREMAKMELDECTAKKTELEEEIKFLLIPQDPEDDKNAVVELRAGTGGDEASIFCGDLFRMYTKYCESKGWKTEVVDVNHGTSGGYKEVVFNISGPKAYGLMKYESGVHRVQRVPQTETQGRVHTSAATVAVLPEADEFDIDLKPSDIRKDTYCASGPGGQSVNTTYSAVRVTHIPTGIAAQCQDQKSQIKNYEKAMKVLRSRIYEIEHQKHLDEIAGKRKTMVSSGDRSAKIRTYNYAQGRVTDHRINLTLYNLSKIIDGDLTEITEALQIAENTEKLKETEQH